MAKCSSIHKSLSYSHSRRHFHQTKNPDTCSETVKHPVSTRTRQDFFSDGFRTLFADGWTLFLDGRTLFSDGWTLFSDGWTAFRTVGHSFRTVQEVFFFILLINEAFSCHMIRFVLQKVQPMIQRDLYMAIHFQLRDILDFPKMVHAQEVHYQTV